MDKEDPK